MATTVPRIQILSKNNYEEQYIVSLTDTIPLAPLHNSAIRVSPKILSLTTNNFTYARLGHLVGWWDVHPLPPSTPAGFSDVKKYGRISAWGYGVVVESNVTGVEVGTQLYGYLPIGTLPVDLEVQLTPNIPGQILEISKQREKLMSIYNRYMLYSPATTQEEKAKEKQSQGYDSLFQVLFETGYLINRFVLAWEPDLLVLPSDGSEGLRRPSADVKQWTLVDAKVGDNTNVLIFSASGKTALAFAYLLKHRRPTDKKPRAIVGIGSDSTKTFTQQTGLYDYVLAYDSDSRDLGAELALDADSKIIIVDFGSRGGAADRWADKLRQSYKNVALLGVGVEVVADSPEKTTEKILSNLRTPNLKTQVNASEMRSQAMKIMGEKSYFKDFWEEWNLCKEGGVVKGLRLVWGQGMDDLAKAWETLYKGEFGPDEGFVFDLSAERIDKI
ncbi:hypothetical protein OIDMADRAFT_149480 [Oidiodendron maius Zn]|uniref:Uncharacterized protein n=1 Tax=Oidiodendron maius (strain Zn) TaxID=913774 RepID=A0A0C3GE71_OIDMZ|nr:hypothetical protein OIDMADRAFT_149480 [Oidiodendron maius Zn]